MRFFAPIVLALGLSGAAGAESYPEAKAIVSIGGSVTEIVHALGQGDRIIARDTTSVYPASVNALPDVGYMRRLAAEGVLSVGPDLILARSTSGPPEVLDQLLASDVPIVLVEDQFTVQAALDAVETVGAALGVSDKAQVLRDRMQAELEALAQDIAQGPLVKKRVMFLLSTDGGRLNVSGRGTGAHGVIELAGGENVMAEAFEGYKLVDAESVINAAPEVVVMMQSRGNQAGRKTEVLALPALALTPAGRNGGFVAIPGAALGFGPRIAAFARDLHNRLYDLPEG